MTTTNQNTDLFRLLNKLYSLDPEMSVTPMIDEVNNIPVLNVYMNDYGCMWNFNILPDGKIYIEEFSEDSLMCGKTVTWNYFIHFLL